MDSVGSGKVSRYGAISAIALAFVYCSLAAAAPANASAADDAPDLRRFVTVRFADGTSAEERSEARAQVGARFEHALLGAQLQQISLPSRSAAEAAADSLEGRSGINYAVASGEWQADDAYPVPFDDPFLERQWSLANYGQIYMSRFAGGVFEEVRGSPGADIGAVGGWDAVAGASLGEETIGVIDTGVAYQHSDLAANVVPGADFFDVDGDPRDPNGHGTHVASIAAGVADNAIGTVGVNPWAKVMPLRAADPGGNFSWAAIEQAVVFALERGVRVFNGSFGGAENNPAFAEIIRANVDALFIFSAGNTGANHDAIGGAAHRYPCDLDLPNVICVGASDAHDALAGFSDVGQNSVDLIAPGVSIYAAKPCLTPAASADDQGECPYNAGAPNAPVGVGGGNYAFQLLSGTSMAAPMVAGAVSLVWARCPALRSSQAKRAVVTTVDRFSNLQSKTAWGGRLSLARALGSVASCPPRSDGTDWPLPPGQDNGPGIDGVGNGGGGGGTGSGTPGGQAPPKTSTLSFRVTRPARARLSSKGVVKFKLRCSERCAAGYLVQPLAEGLSFQGTKKSLEQRGAGTRTLSIKLPATTLRHVRLLLRARTAVRLKVTLTVTDHQGITSKPLSFSIRLKR